MASIASIRAALVKVQGNVDDLVDSVNFTKQAYNKLANASKSNHNNMVELKKKKLLHDLAKYSKLLQMEYIKLSVLEKAFVAAFPVRYPAEL